MPIARRTILGALAGTAALGTVGVPSAGAAPAGAAASALARLLPRHHDQVTFRTVPRRNGHDAFRVSGTAGRITVEGTTAAVQLTGFHHYLRRVAHAHVSWRGEQTALLPARLPAVGEPVAATANVAHRFVFNDTNDGYTGPYHDWDYWERELDVLALHGFNEVLVYIGADAVYHRTFIEHGYSDAEVRAWVPGPAHQPWWLMQNMASFGGPVSPELLDRRTALARKIVRRLRELGMTPVLPGYFGTVPPGYAERNKGARTIPQGGWCGFDRPDWLDPRTPHFAAVARTFYRVQQELYGASTMYKMDLLHEGGSPGDVPVGAAAKAVEKALRAAHPDAVWAILGWQHNPRREIVDAVDRSRMLVLDGIPDRFPKITDRERDWGGTPYAFGTIWNFGGHTALGANAPEWVSLYERWRTKPGSALRGIAVMPEAADNDPAALALFSDLAWTSGPVDLGTWFGQWAVTRYGAADAGAARAWDALRRTAYGTGRADSWSEQADGLFGARPDLAVDHAASWSPRQLRYDAAEFEAALPALLSVAPPLRASSAYRADLVDVARQCVANRGRLLLPRVKAAYDEGDRERFGDLTRQWLDWMDLLERIVATDDRHLLGRWLSAARAWGSSDAERDRLQADALTLLTVWGPRHAADAGKLHDYANREWAGLVGGLYRLRWQTYFTELETALDEDRAPHPVDWFALEDRWTHNPTETRTRPTGDIVRIARTVASRL